MVHPRPGGSWAVTEYGRAANQARTGGRRGGLQGSLWPPRPPMTAGPCPAARRNVVKGRSSRGGFRGELRRAVGRARLTAVARRLAGAGSREFPGAGRGRLGAPPAGPGFRLVSMACVTPISCQLDRLSRCGRCQKRILKGAAAMEDTAYGHVLSSPRDDPAISRGRSGNIHSRDGWSD